MEQMFSKQRSALTVLMAIVIPNVQLDDGNVLHKCCKL